jgi:hypothetical protein
MKNRSLIERKNTTRTQITWDHRVAADENAEHVHAVTAMTGTAKGDQAEGRHR